MTTLLFGAASSIWTQLTLPNPPSGAIPFIYTDNATIAADVSNFFYDSVACYLNTYGSKATVLTGKLLAKTGKTVVAELTGFAYTFPSLIPPNGASNAALVDTLIVTPAGDLATGTVTAPASPVDGQDITVMVANHNITLLTVVANVGQTLLGGAAAILTANTSASWRYDAGSTTWYKK